MKEHPEGYKDNLELVKKMDPETRKEAEEVLEKGSLTDESMALFITEEVRRFETQFPYMAYTLKTYYHGLNVLQENQTEIAKVLKLLVSEKPKPVKSVKSVKKIDYDN